MLDDISVVGVKSSPPNDSIAGCGSKVGKAGGAICIEGRFPPSKLLFRSRLPDCLRSPSRSLDVVRLRRDPKDVVRRAVVSTGSVD